MADYFAIQAVEKVHVLELRLPPFMDSVEFDRLNTTILERIEEAVAQPWVLDLTATTYMGSAMLGLVVNIRQRIKRAGGRLVLCGMSPKLTEIFRMCSMERLFTIVKTQKDALKASK